MLSTGYGSTWEAFEGDCPEQPLPFECLTDHLAGHRDIVAVSSHRLMPGKTAELAVFPIALVREPLDRAYSAYSFERRVPPAPNESNEVAKTTDFAGYVRWCLDNPRRGGMALINYQTIHLSAASLRGSIYDIVATERDYERAARFLTALPVVGVVDRFDNFCERLQPALERWRDEPLDLGPVRRSNISPERAEKSLPEARARLRALLGAELLHRFDQANRLDQALYEFASDLAAAQNRAFLNSAPSHIRPELRRAASAGR
jgi:hypothetical protein